MNTPTLETERLILRKFTENDLKVMYLIYSDEEVNRFCLVPVKAWRTRSFREGIWHNIPGHRPMLTLSA